jgi:hypothetical protein
MAAKKKHKAVAPQKPKKRAGPVKKKKASTKPKVRPAADVLDNTPPPIADAEAQPKPFRAEAPPPPYRPMADDNLPPPFRPSQPPSMNWGNNSLEAAAQVIAISRQIRNAAMLATSGAVEPPLPSSSPVVGSPAFGQNHRLAVSDPNALHAEMLERIEALEREIDNLREQQRCGVGHNNPPEPIELAPLSEQNLGEIGEDIAVLKKQPPADPRSTEAKAAVARLMKFARVAVTYAGKQADIFITAAMTKAGRKIIWSPIICKLWALPDIAHQWLQSLPHL